MHMSKPIGHTRGTVSPPVNYGLQFVIMYQYWFINSNKCTTLIEDMNNRGNFGEDVCRTLYFTINFSVSLEWL